MDPCPRSREALRQAPHGPPDGWRRPESGGDDDHGGRPPDPARFSGVESRRISPGDVIGYLPSARRISPAFSWIHGRCRFRLFKAPGVTQMMSMPVRPFLRTTDDG